jgi:translation initiation factor IF-3
LTSEDKFGKISAEKRSIFISTSLRVNHNIRATKLRVLDENGNQLGILSKEDALKAAIAAELDLVEISPNADPPVARIVDWGKFNYQRTKQLQKNKRNSKTQELKQIRYGLKIGSHDLEVKNSKVLGFLADGHKVRLTVVYRGRELAHRELGYKLLDRIIEELGENVTKEHEPLFAGKQLNVVVRSTK